MHSLTKALVSSLQQFAGRAKFSASRKDNARVMQPLNGVQKGRSIALTSEILPDFNSEIWSQTNEVTIKGSVMQGTKGKSIADHGLPSRFRIRNDMRRVEQLFVSQAAEGTLSSIRLKYALPECSLVQAYSDSGGHVASTRRVSFLSYAPVRSGHIGKSKMLGVIDGDCERKMLWIIVHDEDRPRHQVFSGDYTMYVYERKAAFHGEAQSLIVRMVRVCPTVPVAK